MTVPAAHPWRRAIGQALRLRRATKPHNDRLAGETMVDEFFKKRAQRFEMRARDGRRKKVRQG